MTAPTRTGRDFADLLYTAADQIADSLPGHSVDPRLTAAIRELLHRIGDEINDNTQERWFRASDGWHLWMYDSPGAHEPRSDWTAAVAVARHLVGEPAPRRENSNP